MGLLQKKNSDGRRKLLAFKKRHMSIERNMRTKIHNSVHIRNIQCATNTTITLKMF